MRRIFADESTNYTNGTNWLGADGHASRVTMLRRDGVTFVTPSRVTCHASRVTCHEKKNEKKCKKKIGRNKNSAYLCGVS